MVFVFFSASEVRALSVTSPLQPAVPSSGHVTDSQRDNPSTCESRVSSLCFAFPYVYRLYVGIVSGSSS